MVGLPGLVQTFSAAAEEELVLVAIRERSLESQGDQGRIYHLDNLPHGRVARGR